jgi:hypothetical protein
VSQAAGDAGSPAAAPDETDGQPTHVASTADLLLPSFLSGGARVRFHGLKKRDHLNGTLGFCMPPPADPSERIRVLVASTGQVALVKPENLQSYECVALRPIPCLHPHI